MGVTGGGGTYVLVALRRSEIDLHWRAVGHPSHSLLGKVSNRIINEGRGINQVVYSISWKRAATIEWE